MLAYVEHLDRSGELDLEATTEFLVLIAALLELKSRLMLPGEEQETVSERAEAIDELLGRMIEYARYRAVAAHLHKRLEAESGFRYRSAALPAHLRRISLEAASKAYEPTTLAGAVEGLLRVPERVSIAHLARPLISVEQRLSHLRALLAGRATLAFEEAVAGADRLTEAVTLFALLELYKIGEADWKQDEPFGPISIRAAHSERA